MQHVLCNWDWNLDIVKHKENGDNPPFFSFTFLFKNQHDFCTKLPLYGSLALESINRDGTTHSAMEGGWSHLSPRIWRTKRSSLRGNREVRGEGISKRKTSCSLTEEREIARSIPVCVNFEPTRNALEEVTIWTGLPSCSPFSWHLVPSNQFLL